MAQLNANGGAPPDLAAVRTRYFARSQCSSLDDEPNGCWRSCRRRQRAAAGRAFCHATVANGRGQACLHARRVTNVLFGQMGFVDRDQCIQALLATNGNVAAAIERCLGM